MILHRNCGLAGRQLSGKLLDDIFWSVAFDINTYLANKTKDSGLRYMNVNRKSRPINLCRYIYHR
jgi:hypothetical protein